MRDCALGLESVARLIAGEPLRRVDEPGFGVLALESAPAPACREICSNPMPRSSPS